MPYYDKNQKPDANATIPFIMTLNGQTHSHLKGLKDKFGLQVASKTTFRKADHQFSFPIINEFYERHTNDLRDEINLRPDRTVMYGHDSALDSPGHCANIAVNVLMDAGNVEFDGNGIPIATKEGSSKIVTFKVVHTTEVSN